MISLDDCRVFDLKRIADSTRGVLTVAEGIKDIPFEIKRVYWINDVPKGEGRGGHAHKKCVECIVAVNGSFEVTLDNGTETRYFRLNHPWEVLFVDKFVWRTLGDFSHGAVCLVLASEEFDEEDYIRDYDEFRRLVENR